MDSFPLIFRVRQRFDGPRLDDPAQAVMGELSRLRLDEKVTAGQSVAITAGSRGIQGIANILRGAVEYFRRIGAQPFIVPAMGSHGGATSEGQMDVLASLGVTEAACGCPIRASMDTVVVCQAPEGFPVYFDRLAYEADHVLVVNRVKAHTGFTGDLQSGLMKMMLIGLGKKDGADIYHRAIQDFSFGQIVRSVAQQVLDRCHILAGLAIVENGYEETAWIEAVMPHEIERREPELLQKAIAWMPGLPFPAADLLIVDQIGKNISGTGMDTNVIGRKYNDHVALGPDEPRMRYIFVRGLTDATHGNGSGIGIAEFTLRRVVQQLDPRKTATNCVTANHPTGAMIPLHFDTDQEVLDAALHSIGLRSPDAAELMWIANTLHLQELECSQAYWQRAQSRSDLEILCEPRALPIGADGMLQSAFH
jgi:hypothetical protein